MRVVTLTILGCLAAPPTGLAQVDYQADIKPLLRQRCYACHGALRQEAGLRVDTVAAMRRGGDSGPVIVPGSDGDSLLLERVADADPDLRMPPAHEGEALTPTQLEQIRAWILDGAEAPLDERPEADPRDHWAFRPVVAPSVPSVRNAEWVRNPIDAFIAARHEAAGIPPPRSASDPQLLRRLTFDLTGLPPQPEQVDQLASHAAADWYEETVETLLADPRHGERWARHWMDIWRYSDWWGLNAQLRRSQYHMWHWRDWIVESLNSNKGYDQMVREMLAADELYPNDLDRLRATGYLARNFHLFNRQQWMDETVEHVSKSLLGLTMNCAKCHDHKYDPIDQTDYYRLKAVFEPYLVRLDMVPEETDFQRNGIPCVFDALPEAVTYRLERGQESDPDKSTAITPGVPAFLEGPGLAPERIELPAAAWQTARRPWVLESCLTEARQRVDQAKRTFQTVQKKSEDLADADPPEQPTEIQVAQLAMASAEAELARCQACAAAMRVQWESDAGDANALRVQAVAAERQAAVAKARHAVAVAERSVVTAVDKQREAAQKKLKNAQEQCNAAMRRAEEPIKDDDSFTEFSGTQWTPTRFEFSGRDDAHPGFPTWSTGRRKALADWITGEDNPLTARVAANHIWNRHMGQPLVATVFDFGRNGAVPTHPLLLDWLASELIRSRWDMKHLHRLIVNSQTYRMSSSTEDGEAQKQDPENHLWWRRPPLRLESQAIRDAVLSLAGTLDETQGGPVVAAKDQAQSRRRSLYFFHSNNSRNLMLATFDEASVNECYRRETSIVPQQALALANGRLVRESAGAVAARLMHGQPLEHREFVDRAFGVLLAMSPGELERNRCLQAMEAWQQLPDVSEDEARRLLVWALMNHNDFVTIR